MIREPKSSIEHASANGVVLEEEEEGKCIQSLTETISLSKRSHGLPFELRNLLLLMGIN